jgi:hypothetical protein
MDSGNHFTRKIKNKMEIYCDGTWNTKIISKVAVKEVGHCIMARNYGKISV